MTLALGSQEPCKKCFFWTLGLDLLEDAPSSTRSDMVLLIKQPLSGATGLQTGAVAAPFLPLMTQVEEVEDAALVFSQENLRTEWNFTRQIC